MRPVLLGFQPEVGKYRIFHITKWRVRGDYVVTVDDEGVAVCSCPYFRFGDACFHLKFVEEITYFVTSQDSWMEVDGQRLTPGRVGVLPTKDGRIGLADPKLPDCSVYELVWDILSNEPKLASRDVETRINSGRLYAECCKALEAGVALIDKDVKNAGIKAVRLGDGKDIESPIFTEVSEEFLPSEMLMDVRDSVEGDSEKEKELPRVNWREVPRPDPKFFFVPKDIWQILLYGMTSGKNVLITGPSGSGKSEIVYIAAKALGLPLATFNMGAMSEPRTSLIGATHFSKDKGTFFNESRFVRHVTQDIGVVLLDEITRCERAAYNILLPLMDRQGYLALDESEDASLIRKGTLISFVATANIGMEYTGTEEMDKALRDRFCDVIDMWFPPPNNEEQILMNRCPGLKLEDAKKLVELATLQRDLARNDHEFVTYVSTRMLLSAGEKTAHGIEFRQACKFAIENQFNDDGGDSSERARICQIIQKGGKA